MSEQLKKFFQEYLAWVEAGAKEDPTFSRGVGLCTNLLGWGTDDVRPLNDKLVAELDDLLTAYCTKHGIGMFGHETKTYYSLTPFNTSKVTYGAETNSNSCHLNEKRLDFVRRHAA